MKIFQKLNLLSLKKILLIFYLLFTDVQQAPLNFFFNYHITAMLWVNKTTHKLFDSSECSQKVALKESAKHLMVKFSFISP